MPGSATSAGLRRHERLRRSDRTNPFLDMDSTLWWAGVAFTTVLAAELIGDRSLVTVGALASRFGVAPVLGGALPAFMGKALAAVLLGRLLGGLPRSVIAAVSAATFLVAARALWHEHGEVTPVDDCRSARWPAAFTAFTAVSFTEWADPGQLATAALAVRSHAPFSVWLGATLALATKGLLAVTLGRQIGRRVPRHVVRGAAVCLCITMAVLALFMR